MHLGSYSDEDFLTSQSFTLQPSTQLEDASIDCQYQLHQRFSCSCSIRRANGNCTGNLDTCRVEQLILLPTRTQHPVWCIQPLYADDAHVYPEVMKGLTSAEFNTLQHKKTHCKYTQRCKYTQHDQVVLWRVELSRPSYTGTVPLVSCTFG